jgi:hypothetical protein
MNSIWSRTSGLDSIRSGSHKGDGPVGNVSCSRNRISRDEESPLKAGCSQNWLPHKNLGFRQRGLYSLGGKWDGAQPHARRVEKGVGQGRGYGSAGRLARSYLS